MSTLSNPTEAEAASAAPIATMAKSLPVGRITRPPIHPGEVIAGILEDTHTSMRAAAKAIGVSPTGLEKVLKGRGPVTPEMALRIDALLGSTGAELWLDLQQAYDLWHARERLAAELAAIVPLPNSHPAPPRKRA